MFLPTFLSFIFLSKVHGGEILFAKIPPSIELQEDGTIDQSLLPELFSAALGFSTDQESEWKGLKFKDPFNFAEALVILNVNGIDSIGEDIKNIKKYSLNYDESDQITWSRIRDKLIERYPTVNYAMQNMSFMPEESNNEIDMKFENSYSQKFKAFLKEINNLNENVKQIKKLNEVPFLYWFNINLPENPNFEENFLDPTEKAKNLILNSFLSMSNKFSSLYKDLALVVAIVSDDTYTVRKSRSISNENFENLVVKEDFKNNIYDPNFPVIFNIILWFTTALILALLAVSVFIASMDPGRDSIIYRMTSNRMKKDS